jgi:hypothetical protein
MARSPERRRIGLSPFSSVSEEMSEEIIEFQEAS